MRLYALPLVLLASAPLLAQKMDSPYTITQTYVLGGEGGWDYIIPDLPKHRLFIARETRLMVVNPDTGKLLGEVQGINGAHGTAIASSTEHGFATASGDKAVVMFDTKTLQIIKKIPAAKDADAIFYDQPSGRVFSLNGDANSSTVIDAKTGTLIKDLPLGGKPEYGVSAGDGKAYVNLVDKNEIIEIDTKAASITRRWATAPCEQPVPMTIDSVHHRLFSGCRSGVMAVSDYKAGRVVTTAPIGKGVDGAGYDPATGNVFASNLDGTLTVIHQDTPDQYHVVQNVSTPLGSRNMAVDKARHRLFVVAGKFGPVPPGQKRGPVLPGTFSLLVIEAK